MTPTEIREALRVVVDNAYVVELLSDIGECRGYGFLRPDDPRDFTPDPEECTPEELANHRAAVEAVERGEPVPDQPFTPDAATLVGGKVVHACGGPWGIGSYVMRDLDVLAVRDAVLAARPALSALAGMCVLDVETVRVLTRAARSEMEMMDAIDRMHVEPEDQRSAGAYAASIESALAAADAELRAAEVR